MKKKEKRQTLEVEKREKQRTRKKGRREKEEKKRQIKFQNVCFLFGKFIPLHTS